MKHINRIRNRLEYGEKVLYFIYVFLFFCFLSLDAENKKIRNRFACVDFYHYLCAVYELFNHLTLIKNEKDNCYDACSFAGRLLVRRGHNPFTM